MESSIFLTGSFFLYIHYIYVDRRESKSSSSCPVAACVCIEWVYAADACDTHLTRRNQQKRLFCTHTHYGRNNSDF